MNNLLENSKRNRPKYAKLKFKVRSKVNKSENNHKRSLINFKGDMKSRKEHITNLFDLLKRGLNN